MKKLMIAAAIVCAAMASQAGYFQWKTAKSGGAVNDPTGLDMVSATAYIFESSAAETIYNAWKAGNDWTAGSLDSNTISADGKVATKSSFNYGTVGQATDLTAIFAFTETIGGNEYLYISSSASGTGPGSGAYTLQFYETAVSSALKTTYAGAGWYSSVPEPTSGLLLLLGVAGLALKRRRA